MNIKENKDGGIIVELGEAEVATFAKIGLETVIKEGLLRLKEPKYEPEFGMLGEVWDDESDKRMNIIGQNGNDGLHYEDEDKEGM
jgi:hypothetical protein